MHASPLDAVSNTLGAVVELARRAGALLVELQSTDRLDLRAKLDGSPVTHADRAAHDLLEAGLPAIAPYLVFSEESPPGANLQRRESERVWIVDPLDGTRAYIKGSTEFTVNVALVQGGVPVLGVVVAPALGVTYFAERGAGAYRMNDGGGAERLSCRPNGAPVARIVVSGSDRHVAWTHVACFADVRVDAISSCVKLGYVAEGSAIAYPRITPSSEWDIAAGHAIVTEAGGWVVGLDGRDLVYNRVDPLNTAFVATGAPEIAAAFAAILHPPGSS